MLNKQNFSKTLLAATLLAAFGQAAANDANTQALDTVKVTSGSMNRLGVVPFRQAKSAVAISADTLREEGVAKADELGRYQAGFTNQAFGSDTDNEWFRIRGADATQAIDGKAVLKAGFIRPRTEIYGVEAVEVTKGADSLTFGGSAAGGLINYVSKRAHAEQVGQGEVKLHLGNFKQSGIAADYTGSLNADNSLRYRMVGSVKQADGEVKGSKNRTVYIAPTLQWDITPQTRLDLLANYQQDKGVPSSQFLPFSGSLYPLADGSYINRKTNLGDPITDKEDNKQYALGYELNHQFDKNLAFNSSYRYSHIDNFHTGAYASGEPTNYVQGRGFTLNDVRAKTHSFDNRLTWRFKNNWLDNTLVGGTDYRVYKANGEYGFGTTAAIDDIHNPAASYGKAQNKGNLFSAPAYMYKAKQLGFYLQNQARINKQFVVGLGLRHDRVENQANAFGITTEKAKKNHTSYSASLMYQAPLGFNPYVAYSEAFNVPDGVGANQTVYKPNITKQTEVGVKYLPKNFDGSVSVAAFHAKDQNALMRTNTTTDNNPNYVIRKGVEVQADAHINDNWKAGLAYTYLKAHTRTPTGNLREALFPTHSASLNTQYRINQNLTVGGGLRYVGSSVSGYQSWVAYPSVKVPASTVVDLMARYDFAKNWTAQVNVDNVANKRYLSGCDSSCYYGQGRNINASLSYRFK